MTPLHATAQHIRGFGPAGGNDLALPAAHAPRAVQRAQPVEKIHKPILRTQARPAPLGRVRRPRQEIAVAVQAPAQRAPAKSSERLSPVAKFGDSAPALAHIIAHEKGYFSVHMPNELRAFSRQLPSEAYQATLDRSRYFIRDIPPLSAAA